MLRSFSRRRSVGLALLLPATLLLLACGNDVSIERAGTAGAAAVVPDTTSPAVGSTFPATDAESVTIDGAISATFTEAMAPQTINATTFGLRQGADDIIGSVTYSDDTATLHPRRDLALGATYTATITTAVTDAAGNALATNYRWSFTTDNTPPKGPAPVPLGAASDYVILAESAIANVPTSVVTGNLGLSPAAASFITGFSLMRAGTRWTAPQVIGMVFGTDNDPPTPMNLTTAIGDMQTAYADAAGRLTPDDLDLGGGTIGGLRITPGLYRWTSSVTIPTDLEISGAPQDLWIFQIAGDLMLGPAKSITFSGGARARNVVWQVGGLVDLGTTSHMEGVVLSHASITMGRGASINGRLFAQVAISIDNSSVSAPVL